MRGLYSIKSFFNSKYYLLFISILFVLAVGFLSSRNNQLEFEWIDIVNNLIDTQSYKYLGMYSAYMPPFYPYYLYGCQLFFEKLLGFSEWIIIANFIQSVLFFISVGYFVNSVNLIQSRWIKNLIITFSVFYPPVLLNVTKVSSFAFTIIVFLLAFSIFFRYFQSKKLKTSELIISVVVLIVGIYTRFEFLFFLTFLGLIFIVRLRLSKILFFSILFFGMLSYLPWMYRNYEKIGIFHYSTSFQYNFSKGNNLNYNVFSSYNLPYDSETKTVMSDAYLHEKFNSELEIDNYLKQLNVKFISENPTKFINNSFKKIGINLIQYFPDYSQLKKPYIAIIYSLFSILIFGLTLYFIIRNKTKNNEEKILKYCISGTFSFMILFYSIAPMPRYLLFFAPLFFLYIVISIHSNIKKVSS